MEKTNKNSAKYIQELEDKIVDLSLKLKSKTNQLENVEKDIHERFRKLVHNLKNPIGVAYSFAEMIAESTENISKEKLEKYNDIILKSTDFSIEILNALANLNRLKSPYFKLNYEKTNYIQLINNVIDKFKAEAGNRNISIIKNFPENTIYLNLDKNEITLVIYNLLSNAMRFSPSNSTINITVSENENSVDTKITDEGIGISEQHLNTIFDEFSVVNTYCENNNKCVGLGLSIAKIIVNYHNGEIKAISNLEKGTTINFTISKVLQ